MNRQREVPRNRQVPNSELEVGSRKVPHLLPDRRGLFKEGLLLVRVSVGFRQKLPCDALRRRRRRRVDSRRSGTIAASSFSRLYLIPMSSKDTDEGALIRILRRIGLSRSRVKLRARRRVDNERLFGWLG